MNNEERMERLIEATAMAARLHQPTGYGTCSFCGATCTKVTPEGDKFRCATCTPDLRTNLGMIKQYAEYAVAALNDEHEGNVRHYVTQIEGLAVANANLVRGW